MHHITDADIAAHARRAGDIVAKRGHCNTGATDDQGRVCVVVAAQAAEADAPLTMGITERTHLTSRTLTAARELLGIVDIISWSDHPDRTLDDVVGLFTDIHTKYGRDEMRVSP